MGDERVMGIGRRGWALRGNEGESAGLSLSMRCRDGARARGDRGLRVAALRGSEGRKGGEGIERWALPVDAVCGGGQGPRGREMDRGDRLGLGLEQRLRLGLGPRETGPAWWGGEWPGA